MQCDSKGVSLVPELFEASRLEGCVRAGGVQWRAGQERRTLLVKHYHLHVRQAPPGPDASPVLAAAKPHEEGMLAFEGAV